MLEKRGKVTELLATGEQDALFSMVYDELHTLAARHMSGERDRHTLQTTALVNEAFIRLFDKDRANWEQRRQFYSAASRAMRQILIEHARKGQAQRRGGGAERVTLSEATGAVQIDVAQSVQLADALDKLAAEDKEAAMVARLRFLAGLDVEKVAELLNTSVRTVHREWAFARARLAQMLGER